MSQEKVLRTLESLGLTQPDAQVYILLGKRGPQKAGEIAKSLNASKQTAYRAIKNLESKGIITATLEHPARFSAVPFEKVLDLFVKAKTEEVERMRQDKKGLLSDWQSIALAEASDQSPRFTVIEGRRFIYPRLKQMVEDTKHQLSIVTTVPGLMRAEQFGLFDAVFHHAAKTNAKFRFITELTDENLGVMKKLLERMPKEPCFEGRTPELGLRPISRMLIKDDTEATFFVSQESDKTERDLDDLCLWTNSNSIVNSFKAVFEDLWHNSTSIKKRFAEIETGKPTAKTYIIDNPEAAKKKYDDVTGAAETEIDMITCSAGLVEIWKNIAQLKKGVEKGVSVKIMAPIILANLETALRISECCNVRHVQTSYLETTIVDGKHLFQFKHPLSHVEKENSLHFENTFYSNESEYVEKTKNMFEEVWKNAVTPSALTVEQITKPSMPATAPVPDDEYTVSRKDSAYQKMNMCVEEKPGIITEEYVLNKMINAQRIPADIRKNPQVLYGSMASAVIHPPNSFNLPDLLLQVFHLNKQSATGTEDSLFVNSWLETPKGWNFVPVAAAGDNSKSVKRWKLSLAGTPACQNIHVLKKDELQIQVYGNTLFAGWTVPIPLFPPQYTLPPGSLLVEGYGKLKTAVTTMMMPSGVKLVLEVIGFDAFVTFFHPASKYAGPGTDGTIAKNMIMTVYPPPSPKSGKEPE